MKKGQEKKRGQRSIESKKKRRERHPAGGRAIVQIQFLLSYEENGLELGVRKKRGEKKEGSDVSKLEGPEEKNIIIPKRE